MPQQRLRKQQKQQRETSKGNVLLLDFDETFWCTQKYNEHKLLYMAFNSVSFIRLPLWWSCSQNSVGGTNLIPISNSESDCKILELWWIKSNVLQHSICDETHSHTTPTAGNNKKTSKERFTTKELNFDLASDKPQIVLKQNRSFYCCFPRFFDTHSIQFKSMSFLSANQ